MAINRKKLLSETKSKRNFWKNDDIKILTDLWIQDVPATYIAQILKRSPNAIEVKALRIGLEPRRSELKLVRSAKGKRARVRPCMTCKALFFSAGSGNRICTTCKENPLWNSGNDLHLTFEDIHLD